MNLAAAMLQRQEIEVELHLEECVYRLDEQFPFCNVMFRNKVFHKF